MAEAAAGQGRAEVLRTRDFIGWDVTDAAGSKVGTVSDLLVDRQGRVRFLSVATGLFRGHVLLPVDALEWGDGALVLAKWTAEQTRGLPAYEPDVPLTGEVLEEMERAHPRFYGQAGPPPAAADEPTVVPLGKAKGFKLAKGAPNVRGWTVFGSDNERVGTVHEMLVDAAAMKVRYLDVDLADDLFRLKDDRHVLIPMEQVELRERGEDVWVGGLTSSELARLPAYHGGAVDPLVEERVLEAFGRGERVAPIPAHDVLPPEPYDEEDDRTLPSPVAERGQLPPPPPRDVPSPNRPPIIVEGQGPPPLPDAPPPLPPQPPPGSVPVLDERGVPLSGPPPLPPEAGPPLIDPGRREPPPGY